MKGLVFTVDVPENHASLKVPMLDLAVWVDRTLPEPEGACRVRHTFYAKPSSSPKVFHEWGAYPWRHWPKK